VWNTILRGDHQLNANNTYSVRWLREASPQLNQIVPTATQQVTLAAAREESDIDQTLSTDVNTVLSNTKVNTLRVTWTRENVAFANHCYNTSGRDLANCEPTLSFQTYVDQQDNTAQARIDDAIQLDETLAWFLPNRHGDHDIKAGAQYEYTGANNLNDGNANGTYTFGVNNLPFDANNPFTYPDRFSIRLGGENRTYEKIHYFAAFAQDKWRFTPRLTLSLGLRYDLEKFPIPGTDIRSWTRRRSTRTTSRRASVSPTTWATARRWCAAATAGSSSASISSSSAGSGRRRRSSRRRPSRHR
jgi:outer membrane receptor protein involved in Fe transport